MCVRCGAEIPNGVRACPACATSASAVPPGVRLVLSKGPKETEVILGLQRTMMDLATSSKDMQSTFPVTKTETIIGRAPGSDIPLNHPTVSKVHAKIVFKDRAFWVRDEDSANGVQVNGKEVREQKLSSRNSIKIGQFTFFFIDPNDPEETG